MALNPKLNIYVLTLNPRDKNSSPTFRDLLSAKYSLDRKLDDNELQLKLYQDFLDKVGKDNFRNDTESKKVIGVSKYDGQEGKSSIYYSSIKNLISGIIDGGQYGRLRAYANINNKEHKTILNTDEAVLDKFYICLCTPLNSMTGFLFIQSYTEASIQEPVKKFIQELLEFQNNFFSLLITPYIPKKFIEYYHKNAHIRMFSYRSKIPVSKIMRKNQILFKNQPFDVEINIKPIEDIVLDEETVGALDEAFSKTKFDNLSLGDFGDRSVYIKNGMQHNAHFDITKGIQNIRPTIYLEEEGIGIDKETGQPDFGQIKSYVENLLEEVKNEYNDQDEVEEL